MNASTARKDHAIAVPRRSEVIEAVHARGGKIAAVLPIHYPRSLLRAFGFQPMEVWGPPGVDPKIGSAHLQPYVCSVVRNALSFIGSGGAAAADLIVVPHACDSLQGLASILLDYLSPAQPVLPLYIPRQASRAGEVYLADELRSVYRELQAATGSSPSEEELMRSIDLEARADQVLGKLHRQGPGLALSLLERYRLIRAREFLPAEQFTALGEAALQSGPQELGDQIPLILSGILPEPMALFQTLEEVGATVVADDLACCGRRVYGPGESSDPFDRMAQAMLNAPPDPTRGDQIAARAKHILDLAQERGARGVLFHEIKFCEPELFDLPLLRASLQQAGLPSTVVEVDLNDGLTSQTVTRLQAFVEMLA